MTLEKPNPIERIKLVKAMEFICRNLNDEDIIYAWLESGVADGDIQYGDLVVQPEDMENLEYYIGDEDFADLIDTFMWCMTAARKSGGLYCNGVCAGEEDDDAE